MEFQVGDTIGDYRIIGLLGAGGMGKVFRVRNTISDREEAMKIAIPAFATGPDLSDRFLREIKVLASLDHPNIAALHTAMRFEDRILMFMELIDGEGLDQKLLRGPINLRDAIRYAGQVLSALAFAHGRGVIHRDIKPSNVMVTSHGAVKLMDFGIALPAGDRRLTVSGAVVGSVDYMSPEQIRADPMDARSDLYSVGVMLYETVTGKRPFHAENPYAVMHAHLERNPPPPSEVAPGLPPRLSGAILKSLAKDPGARFQTAREFQAALESLDDEGLPATVAMRSPESVSAGRIAPGQLARVEAALLPVLGPIARNLVAKAARECSTLPALCQSLAGHISGAPEREAFLRICEAATTTTSQPPAVNWDPGVLEAAAQKLAVHIGPIARVIVNRTARRVRTPRELYDALAANIASESDRRKFLASAGDV